MEAQRSADGFSWQIKGATPQTIQTLAPRYECKWLDTSALDYDRAFQQELGHGYCLVTAKGKCNGFQIDIQFRLSKCSHCDRW